MNRFYDRPGARAPIALVILASLLGVRPAAVRPVEASESPIAVVKETTDDVLAILKNGALSADDKRRQIQDVVYRNFDFTTLARLVLARNWKKLTPEQQKTFTEEFKQHLSITYGRNVETYNNEQVIFTGDHEEARGDWTVKTKIARPGGQDILVNYRLRKQDDTWQVIDVVIEGVSLVANFRSQFQTILNREGPVKLIELLHEKNAKGEPLKES